MTKRKPKASEAVTRASPPTVAARVDAIAQMMRDGIWERGETAPVLAQEWSVATNTVEQLSSEAWRRVCAESNDADQVRPTIAGTLAVALVQSARARSHKTTAQLADVYSRVVGARAAERVEHAVVVAQFEALPAAGKAAWLRERAARMLAEADRLEADAGV